MLPEKQRLIMNAVTFEDEKLVSDYNLKDGDSVHLVMKQPPDFQIFVKGWNGNKQHVLSTSKCELTLQSTVGQLKIMICEHVEPGLQTEHVRIIYGTKEMTDDTKKIMEYGMQNNSTIILVGRLLGGE